METEIIMNITNQESRVAVMKERELVELYIDRKKDHGIMGNIYKGKVVKVLPGLQAAFVDIKTEKAAYLYVDDIMIRRVVPNMPEETEETGVEEEVEMDESDLSFGTSDEELGEEVSEDDAWGDRPEEAEEESAPRDEPPYEGMSEDKEETPVLEEASPDKEHPEVRPAIRQPLLPRRTHKRQGRQITHLLKEGQEIMVQVSKEALGTKGPRVTGYISLPGRHLVYMPMVNQIGISRRIGGEQERLRLKGIIKRLKKPGAGYIVRTVSEGVSDDEIALDIAFLESVWQKVLNKNEECSAPTMLYSDLDLAFRVVRDLLTRDVRRVIIDSKKEYDRIKEFIETCLPEYLPRIKLWEKQELIFEAYGIEAEITKATESRVWLKSGGYLVIQRTEALTVIDVNTGRYVGRENLEETIFRTNMEAAKEIAAQLKLRNIGGIIVIDFIDMGREKNRDKLTHALQEAQVGDKAKSRILKISDLGLVEMSRQRTRESLTSSLCHPCLYCHGTGYTKSPTTLCHEIFREIKKVGGSSREKKIFLSVHPDIASLLQEEERDDIAMLERQYQKKIIVKADLNFHLEEYEIIPV